MTTTIQLHNTLSRAKEPLRTEKPDCVTMYVCGPTVYNFAHIGNARPAVVFDVLARLLRHDFREVCYARNFTDVDDKINAAAAQQSIDINELTNRFIAAYHEDMQALGVLSPDLEPRVTDHIPDIIEQISTLIERGHAYVEQEHVLFHVPSYAEYGHLSGRRAEDMLAGARVEVAPYKRDPMDFVLWKPSTPDLPGWDSPWGRGRPGWHIECSAMISKHLGPTIDIHGGGQDLIFPHHENEIAQGTCSSGAHYCHTWVHNSFITVEGRKMSKSLGNVLLVRDLLAHAPGEAIRFALLGTHYRRPMDWSAKRLAQAKQTLTQFYTSLAAVAVDPDTTNSEADPQVLHALRDDLNVPGALTRLHALRGELDAATTPEARATLAGNLLASARLLGLLQQPAQAALEALRPSLSQGQDSEVKDLLAQREEARRQRDFSKADELRERITAAGYAIEDTAEGPKLRRLAELHS